MLFLVWMFIVAVSALYDQSELDVLCDIYYSECETTTSCDLPSTGANACDAYETDATLACSSETTNNDFAQCFINHDSDYFTNCTAYKYLALCLYEETKNISDFSCYNDETTSVDCPLTLVDNIDFDLWSVDYAVDSVPRGSQYKTTLTVDFGTLNVTNPPESCVTFNDITHCTVNPYLIPHMNLHVCKITDDQKTCSCLMLENTESNATVEFSDSNGENPSDGPFDLGVTFDSEGTYKLIAHIQFYEDLGNDETMFWDLANGIDLNVIEPDPTSAPTVELGVSGTDTGSIKAIIIIWLSILACYAGLYLYYKFCHEPSKNVYNDMDYDEDIEEHQEDVEH